MRTQQIEVITNLSEHTLPTEPTWDNGLIPESIFMRHSFVICSMNGSRNLQKNRFKQINESGENNGSREKKK